MLPFWVSISLLSLAQGLIVVLPGHPRLAFLDVLRRPGWGIVPPLSVVGFVLVASAAEHASAQALTYLALVAVPLLGALALGWLGHGARLWLATLVPALFVLAWADRTGLAGEAAALVLSSLSCVSLGVLLAAVTPPVWLGLGIVAMAIADTILVASELLQKPNNALNSAHPAAGLPRLQSALLGSAVIGYGDLFVAAVLGGLLAFTLGRRWQLAGGALTALLALLFDLLFYLVPELPATVPVAVALIVVVLMRRRAGGWALRGDARSTALDPAGSPPPLAR